MALRRGPPLPVPDRPVWLTEPRPNPPPPIARPRARRGRGSSGRETGPLRPSAAARNPRAPPPAVVAGLAPPKAAEPRLFATWPARRACTRPSAWRRPSRAGPDRGSALCPVIRAGSRAEVSIAGRLERPGRPAALVSGQIDRLAVTAAEVLIVDFKTNTPRRRPWPAATPVMSGSSRSTARCLQKLYPRPVRAALLWTETAELMEISTPALEAAGNCHPAMTELDPASRVHRLTA